jgi:hypothetical protein
VRAFVIAVIAAIGLGLTTALLTRLSESFARSVTDRLLDLLPWRWQRTRRRLHLGGTWYAAWETTVRNAPNLNTELLEIRQRGERLTLRNLEKSPQNKVGGYLWRGEARLYDECRLIGWYVATDEQLAAKGALYFTVDHFGQTMRGRWTGCNVDSDLATGRCAIARDRKEALRLLREMAKVP